MAFTWLTPSVHAGRSAVRSYGSGPRYCPSDEGEGGRFGERDVHPICLVPEGFDDHYVYPNGSSTSWPAELLLELVRSIEGLEQAEIIVPGYAVEYDHIDPRGLASSMPVRGITGLYCEG